MSLEVVTLEEMVSFFFSKLEILNYFSLCILKRGCEEGSFDLRMFNY